MLVYIVAGLQALAYLCAIPVCAAFWLTTEGGLRFGVGLAAFEGRAALRRAERGRAPRPKKRRGGEKGGAARALRVLRRLRGVAFSLRGHLDLGDAAATALACGTLNALALALGTRARRVHVDIVPAFDGGAIRVELRGMIRLRSGQIIIAAAKSGMDHINGRIAQWTDIRSKAS